MVYIKLVTASLNQVQLLIAKFFVRSTQTSHLLLLDVVASPPGLVGHHTPVVFHEGDLGGYSGSNYTIEMKYCKEG